MARTTIVPGQVDGLFEAVQIEGRAGGVGPFTGTRCKACRTLFLCAPSAVPTHECDGLQEVPPPKRKPTPEEEKAREARDREFHEAVKRRI